MKKLILLLVLCAGCSNSSYVKKDLTKEDLYIVNPQAHPLNDIRVGVNGQYGL